MESRCPDDGSSLRNAIYGGTIFHLQANASTQRLVSAVVELLVKEFGAQFRAAEKELETDDWFARLDRIRFALKNEPRFLKLSAAVLGELKLNPSEFAVDYLRLRGVRHNGHFVPAARAAYFAHRDTWYGNPKSQINIWIPLHDVLEDETMLFAQESFAKSVANNSREFDYERWIREVGWQKRGSTSGAYPTVTNPESMGPEVGFSAKSGELIVFSGAHLHRTRGHARNQTRFSIDLRAVHLADETAGLGAADADNESQGSALVDYVKLDSLHD